MSVASTDLHQPPTEPVAPTVFVSYRRSDSPSAARQIADALKARFGVAKVFFDTRDLALGSDWHQEIEDRVRASDVIVVVIGPQWVAIADERGRRRVAQPQEEDVVRTEIEAALRGGGWVVPVLVDDAALPAREALPRPFRPITALNAVTLRHAAWDRDLESLVDALAATPTPAAATQPASGDRPAPPEWRPPPGGPGESHYRKVAKALSRGVVVPVVGAGVHSAAHVDKWEIGCGRLPNAAELAGALIERFGFESGSIDLAEVAQQVLAAEGPKPLERALRELLLSESVEPGPIEQALARLPALLRAADCHSYPLLVTTTYDTALERAFERAREPFDLAICLAAGKDRGRFLHIPWYDAEGGGIEPIVRPNEYVEFPIDDLGDLSRTIILKIHGGAVHDAPPGLNVPTGFVVTEDDYIGFMSDSPAENVVPTQLLTKLRDSHFLFVGYGVREWNLRVFLRRVWHEGEPGATSWAVQAGADELDDDFWRTLEVERFDVSPTDYLASLEQLLGLVTGAPPYVGLAPFGEADAGRFFGRDAERKRIIANLQASRFTLLYARSGVGKSSLLRAGVVARLAAAPGSRVVPFIFSSWSGDPQLELPRALGADGDDLEQAIERRAREADGTLLVILDQFEEFFEYHQHTPEGERFADDLARCVRRTDLRAHFLVSIREDAYSRLGDEFKGRLPNVYSNYLHLDDLDERGARAAIEEPLRHNGDAAIEPALVDQVLRDVRRDETSNGHTRYETAHLQYVLRRLWDEESKRGSTVLRLATLEELGGSRAIFERHFDEAVAGLAAAEQDALAKAFRFLISSSGTKRAETAADLAELADVPRPILERALEHLREARILTPVAAGGQARYELAHDLLAAPALEWRQQRERAHELRGLRRIIAALAVVAALLGALIFWALLERENAATQADIARARALVAESANQLSVDPERSLALARRAWQRSPSPDAEKALRRALAASLVRRRLGVGQTWRGTVSQDGGVIVTEGPGGVQAWRGLLSRSPTTRLSGDGRPVISADGGVVAAVGRDGVEVARTDGSGGRVRIAGADYPALSTDGRYAAAVDDRGLRIVDASTGQTLAQRPLSFQSEPVLSFDPSDPERLVAGDCQAGSLTVWNWRDGGASTLPGEAARSARIPTGGKPACLLVVSADGTRAAQSAASGGAKLWDLAHGRRIAFDAASGLAVNDLSWSARGDRLAIAAGKVATVADRDGHELARTPRQVDFITRVTFNRPRGDLIVTASRDGVARIWDVQSAGMLAELRGHIDEIADAAFTADSRDVVTLSLDGSARMWRVVEGRVVHGTDWMHDAAFAPDGKRIATAAADGSARVAPVAGGPAIQIVNPAFPLQTANSIAFDRRGRRVAVAGGHDVQLGEILVGNADTGQLEKAIYPPGRPVSSAGFSPDGKWLVTAAVDTSVALWRLSDFGLGDRSEPTATLDLPRGRSALSAEFSPDGRTIVTAANDGVVRIYDFRTGRVTRELTSPGLTTGATFSPDGRHILTYGSDFIGRIWDVRTGRPLARLSGHSSWISRGAFSPDGRLVVTGSADQTTRVWDALSGRLLSTQREHAGVVNSVAFSPDSKTILSAGDDETVRLYPCATCAQVKDLVRLARDRIVSGG